MKVKATGRDPIKNWSPKHDSVLALFMAGYKYEAIGQIVGFHPNYVRMIVNDPRFQQAVEVARKRILGKAFVHIKERMAGLGVKAVDNIGKTIEGNFEAGSKAKIHQDTVSFELLSRIGFGKREEGGDKNRGISMSKEGEERLIAAIEKSNRAREIAVNAREIEAEESGNGDGNTPAD